MRILILILVVTVAETGNQKVLRGSSAGTALIKKVIQPGTLLTRCGAECSVEHGVQSTLAYYQ